MTIQFWDYLLAGSAELEALGGISAQRIDHCGHHKALSPGWARSVGLWGHTDSTTIRIATDTATAKRRTHYDVFKHRHSLQNSKDAMKDTEITNPALWAAIGQTVIATHAHNRVRRFLTKYPHFSRGRAAAEATIYAEPLSKEEARLGILPVETLLYYVAVEHVLGTTGLTVEDWVPGDETEWVKRARVWEAGGGPRMVTLPPEALEVYPVGHG